MTRARMLVVGMVLAALALAAGAGVGGTPEARVAPSAPVEQAQPPLRTPPDPYGLRGLNGLLLQVDRLPYEVEKEGLSTKQLTTAVELQLRKSGVRVLTKEQAAEEPAAPRLLVQVAIGTPAVGGAYAYAARLSLSQAARLTRSPNTIVDAVTWSRVRVGTIKKSKTEHVDQHVRELIDEFINAYLGENPK